LVVTGQEALRADDMQKLRQVVIELAACRREQAMAHYKALRLVRSRPFA